MKGKVNSFKKEIPEVIPFIRCPICGQQLEESVSLVYKNSRVLTDKSVLVCWDYASENQYVPSIIENLYTCFSCSYKNTARQIHLSKYGQLER